MSVLSSTNTNDKGRTSEVGHSPIPTSERDILGLQCNAKMLLQQGSELVMVLDANVRMRIMSWSNK
jgi:hypothetical protein